MIKTLKGLSKEYTKQPAGIRLSEQLATSLRLQRKDILEWINQPWDGSIPIPGWQFNLADFYKGEDKDNEYNFVVINATGHSYYWPLLRLGCCAPVGLIRKGVAAVNVDHNKTIFRALVLNSFKLFVMSKNLDANHTKIEVGWTEFMEDTGGAVAEKIAGELRNLMTDGLIIRPEDLETDINDSEQDEMNFPSSASGFMHSSGVNEPVRDGYRQRDTYYKTNEATKAWVNQFIQFVKAKLSFVRSVKSSYMADAPAISLGDFGKDTLMKGLTRVTFQLCKYYAGLSKEEQQAFHVKYPFIKFEHLSDPATLALCLSRNPIVWSSHCAFIKRYLFTHLFTDFERVLENVVDLCERCKGNMFAGKDTRRYAHSHLDNSDKKFIEQQIAGCTQMKTGTAQTTLLSQLAGRFVTGAEVANAANIYELGVPESEELVSRIFAGDLKDSGITLPSSIFAPSKCLARGKEYLDMLKDYNTWMYGENPVAAEAPSP